LATFSLLPSDRTTPGPLPAATEGCSQGQAGSAAVTPPPGYQQGSAAKGQLGAEADIFFAGRSLPSAILFFLLAAPQTGQRAGRASQTAN